MITGCCTDICVMQFALSLKTYLNQMDMPQEVVIKESGVATYDALYHPASDYQKMAINMMAQSGIIIR